MKNDQLKPGYNVQMGTENQFILFYTIHQRPTDTRCFIPHLEKLASTTLPMPKTVIADAGYRSEENYVYAVGEEKEPTFDFLIPYGSYVQSCKIYECEDCTDSPLKAQCTKAKGKSSSSLEYGLRRNESEGENSP